jgi:hypothetical protein
MERTFAGCEERYGMVCSQLDSTNLYTARRHNLDDHTATYRPLTLYLLIGLVRLCAVSLSCCVLASGTIGASRGCWYGAGSVALVVVAETGSTSPRTASSRHSCSFTV